MTTHSKAFEVAKELLKLGYQEPNCYICRFFARAVSSGGTELHGSCNCMVAAGLKPIAHAIRNAQSNPNGPLFPVITYVPEGGEEISIPALVASEIGTIAGSVRWPEYYDPIHILFCAFYELIESKAQQKLDD